MKRVALLALIVLLTVTLIAVLWRLHSVLLVFLLSLAIAATLGEPVEWLARRRWPKALAIGVVYGGAIVVAIAFVIAFLPAILQEIDPLVRDLVRAYGEAQATLMGLANPRTAWVARLPNTEQLAKSLAGGGNIAVLQNMVERTRHMGQFATEFVLSIALAIYWTIDKTRFERLWLSLLTPEQRTRTRRVWRKLDVDVGAYMRSELVQTMLAILLFVAGYTVLGIKYPFTLAVVAGLAWLVPFLGVVLCLLPVVIVGWLTGPSTALAASAYTIVVLIILEFYVQRRLYTQPGYWGVLVVAVMLVMADAWGLLGLILAPPIALALQLGINELLSGPGSQVQQAAETTSLPALQARLAALHGEVYQGEEPISPRLANLTARLDTLIAEVESAGVENLQVVQNREEAVTNGLMVGLTENHA
jgi:putative permease